MPTQREQNEQIVAVLKDPEAEYWYWINDAGAYFDMVGVLAGDKTISMPMPLAAELAFGWPRDKELDETVFQTQIGRPPVMGLRCGDRIVGGPNVLGKLIEDITTAIEGSVNVELEDPQTVTVWITLSSPPVGRVPNLRTHYRRATYGVYAATVDGDQIGGKLYSATLYLMPKEVAGELDLRSVAMLALRAN